MEQEDSMKELVLVFHSWLTPPLKNKRITVGRSSPCLYNATTGLFHTFFSLTN